MRMTVNNRIENHGGNNKVIISCGLLEKNYGQPSYPWGIAICLLGCPKPTGKTCDGCQVAQAVGKGEKPEIAGTLHADLGNTTLRNKRRIVRKATILPPILEQAAKEAGVNLNGGNIIYKYNHNGDIDYSSFPEPPQPRYGSFFINR